MQTSWIFLKSLLESPGNLLEICSVKFVDTLFFELPEVEIFAFTAKITVVLTLEAFVQMI